MIARVLVAAWGCFLVGALQANAQSSNSLATFGLKEGDVVNAANAEKYSQLLSPGLQATLKYGWKLAVIEPKHVELPKRYREATERNSGQVKLVKGGLQIDNYIAGLPFPAVDVNAPDAAYKIMWNFYYNCVGPDDVVEKGIDTYTGHVAPNTAITPERHLLTDSYRKLNFNGRIYVEPTPELPNKEGIRFKESVHPILEPFDMKGVGATFYRYIDAEKQDDSWLYLPQLRRVRRLSTAQRSDSLFGQDTDADGFWGYNGHIAWMNFKMLGERVILAPMHARNVPAKWQQPEDWLFDDVWEPRSVYVIEAESKLPQYAFGKRVLFVDKEAWIIATSDSYDKPGELWKVWVNLWSFRKEAVPGKTTVPPYEDEMPFLNAVSLVDVQLQHSTSTAIPRSMAKADGGMYMNVGAKMGVEDEFFSVAHLIAQGN